MDSLTSKGFLVNIHPEAVHFTFTYNHTQKSTYCGFKTCCLCHTIWTSQPNFSKTRPSPCGLVLASVFHVNQAYIEVTYELEWELFLCGRISCKWATAYHYIKGVVDVTHWSKWLIQVVGIILANSGRARKAT